MGNEGYSQERTDLKRNRNRFQLDSPFVGTASKNLSQDHSNYLEDIGYALLEHNSRAVDRSSNRSDTEELAVSTLERSIETAYSSIEF